MEEKKPITFSSTKPVSAEDKSKYQDIIKKAQHVNAAKGREPLGTVERPPMPDFQQLKDSKREANPFINPETQEKLEQLAGAVKEESEKKKAEEEKKKEEESLFDALDFADQRSEAEKILNNRKLREDIESRCSQMKVEDLLYKDEVHQTVPIIPGKFEAVFRSMTQTESLFIKRIISREQVYSDQYTLEKYNLCHLVCSLVSINGSALPEHRDSDGEPEEKAFETKLKAILKKSGYIIASLGVNYAWFDIRVRRLLTPEALKNG